MRYNPATFSSENDASTRLKQSWEENLLLLTRNREIWTLHENHAPPPTTPDLLDASPEQPTTRQMFNGLGFNQDLVGLVRVQ